MFVQSLGGPTEAVVDHELAASQHTGEEQIHEVKDGDRGHVAFPRQPFSDRCPVLAPVAISGLLGRARDRWLAIDAPEAGDAQQAKEQLPTVVDGSDHRVATGVSWVTSHAPRAAGRKPALGAPY